MKTLTIKSTDNTDVLINVEKIQCVIEKNKGCVIYIDGGINVSTGAKFDEITNAIFELI